MNDEVGEAIFILKIDSSQATTALNNFKKQTTDALGQTESSTRSVSDGFSQLTGAISSLATAHYALTGTASAIGEVVDAYNRYEAAMSGVAAVAKGTGQDVAGSMAAVKELSEGGLLSQADAAASIKNLEAYGYSLEEATRLIQVMTDAAVYNRQSNYSLSEAVRVTTEGIRMENSVLSDASGVNKNIAKMQQEYAASLGKTTDALSEAEKRQAVYNGFLAEASMYAGNAESYTQTLAGSQQQLSNSLEEVKQAIGSAFEPLGSIISDIASWISDNESLAAGLLATAGAIVGASGLVAALSIATKAVQSISQAMAVLHLSTGLVKGGLIGLGIAAVSVGAFVGISSAMNNASTSIEETGNNSEAAAQKLASMEQELESLGKQSESAAKTLAKLQSQLDTLDRDYARDLKKIAVSHEENLQALTQQIEEANVDYRRAIDERMADFNVTLAKQERSHQETVDELMTQLDFLQRYNNDYNKQKLAQVQFALAKEQRLYEDETAKQKAEIELQNEADRQKLEAKLAELQQELDDEMAFMNKHRAALNSVRDIILNDEVESLQERYEAQRASYNDQIAEASRKGAEAASAYWDAYNRVQQEKVNQGLQTVKVQMRDFSKAITWDIEENKGQRLVLDPNSLAFGGWAEGGYTGRGAVDEVAGVVHKGEYVVPASQVDQDTGEPKLGGVQNITINLSGVLATSAQAKRDLAQELVKAINQVNQARMVA